MNTDIAKEIVKNWGNLTNSCYGDGSMEFEYNTVFDNKKEGEDFRKVILAALDNLGFYDPDLEEKE